jgi:probable rRNA maturation factor
MCDPCDSRCAEAQDLGGADSEPPERLHIEIVHSGGDWRLFEPIAPAIKAVGRALADAVALRGPIATAAVAFSSDQHVQALNRAYRGKDKPTNVLSFPAPRVTRGGGDTLSFLGDIVLAAETVAREAAEHGTPPRHHLQHLVVHGLLHLQGYDHECAEDAEKMEAVEVKVLARLGIANPYAEPAAPAAD